MRTVLSWLLLTGLAVAAPQSPAQAPSFFVQLSDPQFGMFTNDREFSQETLNFELAIATVNRWRPAFVVITGDLINKPGDAAQIAEYFRIIGRLDPAIPVHHIAGNHDVENVPTPASLAAYTKRFGPDRYSFTAGGISGVVLNSSLIHSPGGAPAEHAAQLAWLKGELTRLRHAGARHLVVFQHHPWFLAQATEADQYFNIPRERRDLYLSLFREAGVRHLFSGHYHRNAVADDAGFEMVTTGPVGKPLGAGTQSGLRVVVVRESGISHRYYALGELPNTLDIK